MYRTVNKNQLACKQKKKYFLNKNKVTHKFQPTKLSSIVTTFEKGMTYLRTQCAQNSRSHQRTRRKKEEKKFIYAAPCMCSVYGIVWIRLHKQFQSPRLPAGNTYLSLISGDSSSTFVLFPKRAEVRHYAKTSSSCREGDCRNTADTIHYAERKQKSKRVRLTWKTSLFASLKHSSCRTL